ncbi:MAG: glutamate--tRNA ligase [Planctomycetota bacterium]
MSEPVRVRIAPSPTGTVHLGLCRTALFNWATARRRGGKFILRIEDTDHDRSTAESEAAIVEGLRWLGLDWDEGPDVGGPYAPYRQSERIERHHERAGELLAAGHAYRCFCTRERLDALRAGQEERKETARYDGQCRDLEPDDVERRLAAGEPFAVRFRVPEGATTFDDLVRGTVTFAHAEVDDWVMVRQVGGPTYNFVVVCDDIDMRITEVLRGEEHLVNTPKQLLLYAAFGAPAPAFGHLPLMLGPNRKKLSKRHGDTALGDYRANGYPREAIVNFLCLQGWALDGATEVFDVATFVERFDPRDVQKAGAVFDFDKFKWLSGELIRRQPLALVAERCAPFVVAGGLATEGELRERARWFEQVVAGEQERILLYSDLPGRIAHFFAADEAVPYAADAEAGARKHAGRIETLAAFRAWLAAQDPAASAEVLGAGAKAFVAAAGLKLPALFQPLRCALTGMAGGRDLFDVVVLLGREHALARIEAAERRLA